MERIYKNQFTGMDYIQLIQPYGEANKNISTRLETLILDYKLTYHSEPIHHIQSRHIVFGVPVYYVNGKEYFPVEIQFRTMAMDLWASMEHQMCYKKNLLNSERNNEFREYVQQLKKLEEEIENRYGE